LNQALCTDMRNFSQHAAVRCGADEHMLTTGYGPGTVVGCAQRRVDRIARQRAQMAF
jgi:hypothetical protein